MTEEQYIRREFFKAKKLARTDVQAIKVRNSTHGGESRWINLPDHVADLVAAIVALTPEEAEVLTLDIRHGGKTSDALAWIDRMILGLDMETEN